MTDKLTEYPRFPASSPPRGTIEVLVKDQYGKQTYHPHNNDAHLLAQLAGTKTLTATALKVALKLGYEITYIIPEVQL